MIIRAFKKISRVLTPLGQLAAQDPQRRHRSSLCKTPLGSSKTDRISPSKSINLPLATSLSFFVTLYKGQTDWQIPHREHRATA